LERTKQLKNQTLSNSRIHIIHSSVKSLHNSMPAEVADKSNVFLTEYNSKYSFDEKSTISHSEHSYMLKIIRCWVPGKVC